PLAMTLDHEGNVLVTGYSDALDGVGVNYDFVTLKYDPMGALIFSDRTGTSGNRDDRAAAVAAHTDGSFYVAGYSSQGSESRIRVIKYDTAGSVDWDMEYAPINYLASFAAFIGLDEAGNAFVGGKSYSSDTNWDYTLVKLNPDGDRQWTAHYNGLANGYDESTGLAVTENGTAYLTGLSMGQFSASDCATLSYSPNGALNWAAIYNDPSSSDDGGAGIALAPNDQICVVGNAYNGFALQDYLILNYSSAGAEQWAAFYNGPSDLWDQATDLCLSQDGDIYVAGSVSHTYLGRDFLLIKYDADGMAQWTATYNHSANEDDRARQVVVDVEGNVYVTGASDGLAAQDDYATLKYNSMGEQQWVARHNGLANNDDEAEALGVTSQGEVCVTGRSENAAGNYDVLTLKYDVNGILQWEEIYGSATLHDWGHEVVLDSQDNILVGGRTMSNGLYDYCVIKYNAGGSQIWANTYNGPAQGSDVLAALAIDPSDNVYAAGESEGSGTDADFLVVKYNPAGDLMWTARYDGSDHLFDGAADLGIDSQGNVIVTGSTETASGLRSIMTVKYNPQGVLLWAQVYDSTAGRDDAAKALAVGNDDRIYVTGSSFLEPAADYLTIVYSPSGELLGSAIYNAPANGHDEPVALAASPDGDVYVTGRSYDLANDDDVLTIKYSMVTGIGDQGSGGLTAPVAFRLNPAYPNPFNASATIRFQLPISGMTRLEVFDLAGRMVGKLVDGWRSAGTYQVGFDGANLASGIYICRMQAGDFAASEKMVLMK
ncbi:MAG TPA: T9SS type A sorting domain-containing protein, partial [bacterium]